MNIEQNTDKESKKRTAKRVANLVGAVAVVGALAFSGERIWDEMHGDPPDPVNIETVDGEDGENYGFDEDGNRYVRISTWSGDPNAQPKTLIGEGVSQRHVQDVVRDNGLKTTPAEGRSYWVREDYLREGALSESSSDSGQE